MEELLNIKKRFSRASKEKFLNIVEKKLKEYGYECETKTYWRLLKSTNLATKIENPEYIFMAHYDTGTIVPFWYNWLVKLFGINRLLLIVILCVALWKFLMPAIENYQPIFAEILKALVLISCLTLFIPNPQNYDDNTSGVITLLKLAKQFKEKGIHNVQFLFPDHEESGLWGSSAHRKYLIQNKAISDKCKIISIDCVGGKGKIPLIFRNSKSAYEKTFKEAIENEFNECKSLRFFLPWSDNFSFRKHGAINISFVNQTIIPNGYYLKDIHSHKDHEIDLKQIERLCKALVEVVNKNNRG